MYMLQTLDKCIIPLAITAEKYMQYEHIGAYWFHMVLIIWIIMRSGYSLLAPSNYLDQCWLIINELLWQSPKWNFTRNTQNVSHFIMFENFIFHITHICYRVVKKTLPCHVTYVYNNLIDFITALGHVSIKALSTLVHKHYHINGLVQERCNSVANALE